MISCPAPDDVNHQGKESLTRLSQGCFFSGGHVGFDGDGVGAGCDERQRLVADESLPCYHSVTEEKKIDPVTLKISVLCLNMTVLFTLGKTRGIEAKRD